ncbi:MAG: hypothetical protein P4M05_10125 [Bradyrhizobium sp.]|nr:hypothetical protein [Bradyrhizobium sp.]
MSGPTSAKIDGRKTEEFREAARARADVQWTAEARAAQSELIRQKLKPAAVRERISDRTRIALADPEVHRRHVAGVREAMTRPDVIVRISAGTRAGMARWHARLATELRSAWRRAPKKIRAEFLAEIAAATAAAREHLPSTRRVSAPTKKSA